MTYINVYDNLCEYLNNMLLFDFVDEKPWLNLTINNRNFCTFTLLVDEVKVIDNAYEVDHDFTIDEYNQLLFSCIHAITNNRYMVFFDTVTLASYYNIDITDIPINTITINGNTYTPVAYIESTYNSCIYGVVYSINNTYIYYVYGARTDCEVEFDTLIDMLNDEFYCVEN